MKANELRIDNWIMQSGKLHRLHAVDIDYIYHGHIVVEPIPLTLELLEKIGFEKETKKCSIEGRDTFDIYTLGDFVYNTSHGHFWISGKYGFFVEPLYVHQLQNLYFALTGHELTIKQD